MVTLAEAEAETASRVGPFYALTATGGTADAVVVAALRTSAELGGYEGLYLLRREATQATDRVRTVDRFDGTSGSLVVDFPYTGPAAPGEPFELHHLHPDLQLEADVLAALRRCYLLDTLVVAPPPDALAGDWEIGLATVREVAGPDGGGGWTLWGANGNGAGPLAPRPPRGRLGPPGASRAAPGGAAAVLNLTAQAFWLTSPRQVLGVASDGGVVAPAGRYGDPTAPGGWTCWASRGSLYLGVPGGVPLDTLTVRAYRDAFGLVDDGSGAGLVDTPAGPTADDDELAVPLDYVCAFAHIEAWRRQRDRLEAAAAEGRFPSQTEAAAEATRCASVYADFLFRPATERGDRPASPWGYGASSSPSGLGGTGALAGAVVNSNDPYA